MRKTLWPASAAAVVGLFLGVLIAPPAQAIYNGYEAPFDQYRFMVSLRSEAFPDAHMCGGTLIAADIVLTAAHCTDNGSLVAVVGRNTQDWQNAPRVPVVGVTTPNTYDIDVSNRHDIAVLRLATPQTSPTITLASVEPRTKSNVETAGWGSTDKPLASGTAPTALQATHLKVASDRDCGSSVMWDPPADAPTSICAANSKSSVNHGDSGGPLLVADGSGGFTQVGVTSLGSDNPKKLVGAFTSIPIEMEWINKAIGDLRGGDVLVFGTYSTTNGRENLSTWLRNADYKVTVSDTLPDDLAGVDQIWWYGVNDLSTTDEDRLISFARSGGRLFLSGEWQACSCNNGSVERIFNALVVTVGGLQFGPDMSTGTDEPTANRAAIDDSSAVPNSLSRYLSNAIGTIDTANIGSEHMLFTDGEGHGTIGLWNNTDVYGGGRLAIVMDVNWAETGYGNTEQSRQVLENVAHFLGGPISPDPGIPLGKSPQPADSSPLGHAAGPARTTVSGIN